MKSSKNQSFESSLDYFFLMQAIKKGNVNITLNTYQQAAMATAVYPEYVGLAYTSLGLAGEAGEIANKVKKIYRDNDGELTRQAQADLMDELGDVLWYVAALATEIGYDLDDVAAHNLEKLAARKARNAINGTGDKR